MPQITTSYVNLSSSAMEARPSRHSKAARYEDNSSKGEPVSNEEEKTFSGHDGRRDVLTDIRAADCLKLPILTKATRCNDDLKNRVEVLLRRKQFPDLTIRELKLDRCGKRREKLSSSCLRRHEVSPCIPQRRAVVSDENVENNSEDERNAKEGLNENSLNSKLQLSCSILEGQRVNLREKVRINKQRKQIRKHCEPPKEGNELLHQSETSSKHPDHVKNFLMKSMSTQRNKCDTASLNPGKRNDRPVFHLPKADKYDISPRGVINNQVCSVFRVNDVKSSSLLYSSSNDAWSLNHDNHGIKHSVFKAFTQQPPVFLREPSPVAGVKINLKEHEDAFAEAMQAVEKTNALTSAVDTEVTRQVKKFVIRLPPIC